MSLVGNLEDLSLGDILQIISLSQKSGVLALSSELGTGRIVFGQGLVQAACVKGAPNNLRDLLVARGELDPAGFDACAVRARDLGQPIEAVLESEADLSSDRILELIHAAVESAILEMFTWPSGDFSFDVRTEPESDDPVLTLQHGMNAQYLAMEGLRLRDERARDAADEGGSGADAGANVSVEEDPLFGDEPDVATTRPHGDAADALVESVVRSVDAEGREAPIELTLEAVEAALPLDRETETDPLLSDPLPGEDDAPAGGGDADDSGPLFGTSPTGDDTEPLVTASVTGDDTEPLVVASLTGDDTEPLLATSPTDVTASGVAASPTDATASGLAASPTDVAASSVAASPTDVAASSVAASPTDVAASSVAASATDDTEPRLAQASASVGTPAEAEPPAATVVAAVASDPSKIAISTSQAKQMPVVLIEPDVTVLDWVKGAIEDDFARVHVFQQAEQGLSRIRQYLIRGQVPLVLVSPDAQIDPLSGIRGLSDFVKRLKAQSPRIVVVGLREDEDGAPAAMPANLNGVLRRPPRRCLVDRSAPEGAAASEALARELLERLAEQGAVGAPKGGSTAASASLRTLRDATSQLQAASSRGEILPVVLDFAAELFARVAILIIREDTVFVVAGRGISALEVDPLGADAAISFEMPAEGWIAKVLETGRPVIAAPATEADRLMAERFGGAAPNRAYLGPIESSTAIIAMLYGDQGGSDAPLPDTHGLEVVLQHAGLALDRAALERALWEADANA